MEIIEIVEIDKKRSKIFLDSGVSFVLYKGEIRTLCLKVATEVSEEMYQEIRSDILVKRAQKRVLHLLEKTDKTEQQLRDKLRQGFYEESIIEQAIEYVRKYNYLDDERYAQNYVRFQGERKSQRQIQGDLLHRGIKKEVIEQVLKQEYKEDNELQLILKWVEKRHYSKENADSKEKQKMYQFLARKGFHSNDILHVLDHLT